MAIGDVHGDAAQLRALLASIDPGAEDELVFLGDLIDYGTEPAAVLSIVSGLRSCCRVHTLWGNHELMLLDHLRGTRRWTPDGCDYEEKGGSATLAALDLAQGRGTSETLPAHLLELWARSRLALRRGAVLFVHGGLSEDAWACRSVPDALAATSAFDVVWDRTAGSRRHQLGARVVHGHTVAGGKVRDRPPWTVGVDTGVAFGGPLSGVELDSVTGAIVNVHCSNEG